MHNLQLNNIVGFHIEPTNICTLKCAGCARTRFIQQWPSHWKNHSVDLAALFKFLDVDLSNKHIHLCGNYGDPIYHPEFIDMVREFKHRGAEIKITTNGSHRKPEWWIELCNLLTDQDLVRFSIDGLPENFAQYRVNADWESIRQGIDVCVQSSCQTAWKYIPFNYNQHNIDQAKQLSDSLGIDSFQVHHSDRFDHMTEHLKPDSSMLGERYQQQVHFKNSKPAQNVDPQCANQKEYYISADGFFMPCCYIGDHRFYYKTQFGKDKNRYSIENNTLTSILNQPTVIDFYQSLDSISACQYNCPKID
jgi:MoaA/NifB/PqqE/SkfB family radical SAM enzyme